MEQDDDDRHQWESVLSNEDPGGWFERLSDPLTKPAEPRDDAVAELRTELADGLARLEQRLQGLQAQFEALPATLPAAVAQLNDRIAALEARHREAAAALAALAQKLDVQGAAVQLSGPDSEHARLAEEMANLRETLERVEQSDLAAKVERVVGEVRELKGELTAIDEELVRHSGRRSPSL